MNKPSNSIKSRKSAAPPVPSPRRINTDVSKTPYQELKQETNVMKENNPLIEENIKLKSVAHEKDIIIHKLQTKLEELAKNKDEEIGKIKNTYMSNEKERKIQALEAKLEEAETLKKNEIQEIKNKLNKKIEDLEKAENMKNEEIEKINNASYEKDQIVQELQTKLEETEISKKEEIEKIKNTLDESHQTMQELQTKLEETEVSKKEEIEKIKNTLDESHKTIQELQTKLEETEVCKKEENEKIKNTLDESNKTIQELQTKLKETVISKKEEIEKIKHTLDKSHKTIQELQTKLEETEVSKKEENEKIKNTLDESHQTMKELQTKLEETDVSKKEEIEKIKHTLDESHQTIQELETKLKNMEDIQKEEIERLKHSLDEKDRTIEELQTKFKETEVIEKDVITHSQNTPPPVPPRRKDMNQIVSPRVEFKKHATSTILPEKQSMNEGEGEGDQINFEHMTHSQVEENSKGVGSDAESFETIETLKREVNDRNKEIEKLKLEVYHKSVEIDEMGVSLELMKTGQQPNVSSSLEGVSQIERNRNRFGRNSFSNRKLAEGTLEKVKEISVNEGEINLAKTRYAINEQNPEAVGCSSQSFESVATLKNEFDEKNEEIKKLKLQAYHQSVEIDELRLNIELTKTGQHIPQTTVGTSLVTVPPIQELPQNQGEQTPHSNQFVEDSLKKIKEIEDDTKKLQGQVKNFRGRVDGKEYYHLEEMLIRNLVKLDNVESEGIMDIRRERKAVLQFVQKIIEELKTRATPGNNV